MGQVFDFLMILGFVAILAVFVIGFSGQMMVKHKKKLEEDDKRTEENKKYEANKSKDKIND